MTKKEVILKVREKLIKLQFYNNLAVKSFGENVAAEMFKQDLDYLASLLTYLGPPEEKE